MTLSNISHLIVFIAVTFSHLASATDHLNQCLNNSDTDENQVATCLQAITEVASNNNTHDLVALNLQLAQAHRAQKNYEQSIYVLNQLQADHPGMRFEHLYKVLRNTGMNHYYLHQYSQAQLFFQKALLLAVNQADLYAVSQSHNDLGIIFKLQSRYTDALEAYSQSLKIKESLNLTVETASTLYNIGNVYILINDYPSAFEYHQRALKIYATLPENDATAQERVIHIKDQIARSLAEMGEVSLAIEYLTDLIRETAQLENNNDLSFDSRCNLAELYIKTNQPEKALEILEQTQVTTEISDNQQALQLEMYTRTYLSLGSLQQAKVSAMQGLALTKQSNDKEQTTKFLALLTVLNENNQQFQTALEHQKNYISYKEEYLKERYDSQIKYLQNDIELQQKQKQLVVLEKNNMIQQLTIKQRNYLVGIAAFIGLFLLLFIIWYIKKKSTEKKYLLEEINSHKQKLEHMQQEQMTALENMLNPIDEALICLNQSNTIIFVNPQFKQLLATPGLPLLDHKLETILPELAKELAEYPMGKDDLLIRGKDHSLKATINDLDFTVWLSQLQSFDDLLILSFQKQLANIQPSATSQFVDNVNQYKAVIAKLGQVNYRNEMLGQDVIKQLDHQLKPLNETEADSNQAYRQALVNLMYANLEIWREATNGDRISLAEKSGVWKVTIDDGRLRTRAMDRYLSLKLLPKVPRWRPVVKTSHLILAECDLTDKQRKHLNNLLSTVTDNLKAQSTAI